MGESSNKTGMIHMSDGTTRIARKLADGRVEFRTFANANSTLGHAWRKATDKQAATFVADVEEQPAATPPAGPAKGSRVTVRTTGGGYLEPAKVVQTFGEIVLVKDRSGDYFAVKLQHNAIQYRDEWTIVTAPTPDRDVALARLSTIGPADEAWRDELRWTHGSILDAEVEAYAENAAREQARIWAAAVMRHAGLTVAAAEQAVRDDAHDEALAMVDRASNAQLRANIEGVAGLKVGDVVQTPRDPRSWRIDGFRCPVTRPPYASLTRVARPGDMAVTRTAMSLEHLQLVEPRTEVSHPVLVGQRCGVQAGPHGGPLGAYRATADRGGRWVLCKLHGEQTTARGNVRAVDIEADHVRARAEVPADPATEDDTAELVDRIVRRAQYEALVAMRDTLARWVEVEFASAPPGSLVALHPSDVRTMIEETARELRTAVPRRV